MRERQKKKDGETKRNAGRTERDKDAEKQGEKVRKGGKEEGDKDRSTGKGWGEGGRLDPSGGPQPTPLSPPCSNS